jgi:hypothetical protein
MKTILALLFSVILATGGEAVLEWDPNPEPEVTGYRIHYGTESGAYVTTKDAGKVTTTKIEDLTAGTLYYFVATAYDAEGYESLPSNEVSYTPPLTPLTLTHDKAARALEWTDTGGDPKPPLLPRLYRIERTSIEDDWSGADTQETEAKTLTLDDIAPGTYWFRITGLSRNGGPNTEPSNVVRVVILTPPGSLRIAVEASSDMASWETIRAFDLPASAPRGFFRVAIAQPHE